MKSYRLGACEIEQHADFTVTKFPNGTQLTAVHALQDAQRETAAEYSMAPEYMNRTHDLAHSIVAALLGLPESPTLAATASGADHAPDWWKEERLVLALQSYAFGRGIDLEDVAERLATLSPPD